MMAAVPSDIMRLAQQQRMWIGQGLGGLLGVVTGIGDQALLEKTKPSLRIELQRETDDWLEGVL